MSARLADERGVTLIELIVAASMSMIIFGATLTVFAGLQKTQTQTIEHNERQQEARQAIDRLTRDLRNLASPSDYNGPNAGMAPRGVERNGKYDLIFKTVDGETGATATNSSAVMRARYCFDGSNPGRGRLLLQQQTAATFTTTVPPATACPDPGPQWTGSPRVVADHLSNRVGGRDRPVFTYSSDGIALPYDAPDAVTSTTRVEARLWLDRTIGDSPVETSLSSSVILRNQNRPPTAAFTATVSGRQITLNGSASDDPEHEQMTFKWLEGGTPATAVPIDGGVGMIHTLVDRPDGSYTFLLQVTDSAGTIVHSDPVTVKVGLTP
jgi:type II secretory pathway pseudopilin PulG